MMRLLLLLSVVLAVAVSVAAGEGRVNDRNEYCVSSSCFARETPIGTSNVPLRGAGTLRWWGFRVYSAAFYTASRAEDTGEFLGREPHRLVISYYRDIKAADIVKATNVALDQNPDVDREAVQPAFDRINASYVDVKPGDRYELVYEPGVGTSLVHNGTLIDTIPGEEFARALFGIWLSPHALSSSLRHKLLNHR